ncbi:MAG TPA: SDR family oxidoreductase, partial [Pyrinomonadaceae bacterium]|nr:SDR family oxidoreductase [Pyrinomonadaceae bacterium]
VVNDLDAEPAHETLELVKRFGTEAVACVGNVTETQFGERFVESALKNYGAVDIIINNAGYTWDNVIQKMNDEQWQSIIEVHLTAPFRILRAAAEFIRNAAKKEAAEGREVFRKVVNISSISGLCGNAGQVNYAAAKAGIVGATKALSKEWGRYRVNVNCVAFGFIKTRLSESPAHGDATVEIEGKKIKIGVNEDLIAAAESMIPLGRFGTPEEAAGAVYLFCLPESNYISGQTVVCSGGFMM